MKILQVNVVYGKGSTGKITADIHGELLRKNFKSIVCYGRGKKSDEPFVYKICSEIYSKFNNLLSRFSGIMYGGCFFSTNKLIRIIKKEKPDLVHLHCLNGYFVNIYRLIKWLKRTRINTVLTLHAEFMYTGGCGHSFDCDEWNKQTGCGYPKCPRWREETRSIFFDKTHSAWLKMKRSFDGFYDNLIIISVSPWLKDRAVSSTILKGKKHCVVINGLDTTIFRYYDDAFELRVKYAPNGEKIVFHASPYFSDEEDNIKGGYYVIELAKLNPSVVFIVAGPHKYGIKLPSNVVLLGKITDQVNMAKFYSIANITLLTSKRETFSMVTAESLCCGTPVVGFKAGAPEQIAIKEYSQFVDYANIHDLDIAMYDFLNDDYNKLQISIHAQSIYSKTKMTEEYIKLYDEIVNKKKV